MPTLVSAGVSVPINDESFYIPATAPTVPLFFLTTAANKQKIGSTALAVGTTEHSVVRTVTGLSHSFDLYGLPVFRTSPEDASKGVGERRQFHGDCRNEYGLLALNHALGVLSRAYVVRADIDLADAPLISYEAQAPNFVGVGDGQIRVAVGGLVGIELADTNTTEEVWSMTAVSPSTFSVSGSISGAQGVATVGTLYTNSKISFVIEDGVVTPFAVGDRFTVAVQRSVGTNPLGATDAIRRANIVAALASEINMNTDVRSERYEYNIVVCPGYPEVADELLNLTASIMDEAFVIGSIPMDIDAEEASQWALTPARKRASNIAYWYPHPFMSNLDGANVVGCSSGIALRTIAYSDSVSEVWMAPAGAQRGMVVGVETVGYVSGTLGTPTTFVETHLSQGQRDVLYEFDKNINPIVYFPSRGLIVWGQKTSSPVASARDRINVERLLIKVKRDLRKGAFPYVFQPNDKITRDSLKGMIDGYLGDIMIRRGLYDYVCVCDETTNTPTRIDRNELWAAVGLKPVKAAEFIYIPVSVFNTGDSMF